MTAPAPVSPAIVAEVIRRSLDEDLGTAGDITTDAAVSAGLATTGRIVARQDGCVAGLDASLRVFDALDGEVTCEPAVTDADMVATGAVLAEVSGSARALLTGERTCLNLLGHLSGIATATAGLVEVVRGFDVRISDTRKTTPGLRALEKYAVRCGGGSNHRFGLFDAVMLKDNHLAATGSITSAVAAVRAAIGHTVTVELEVDHLEQIPEALDAGVDILLLDNMDAGTLRRAVELVAGRAITEASGGITAATAREIAASGVDVISAGWVTHSAPRLDVALELDDLDVK